MSYEEPELSVVVPVFNEEAAVPRFLTALALQRNVAFEVFISDGGSADATIAAANRLAAALPFPVRVVEGGKGRAAQMNLGASVARAHTLLFLHVDSSFPDPLSLRKGIDALAAAGRDGTAGIAGHFALEFDFDGTPPLPYRYYGAKATLDRPGCTHGDQGMLIDAGFFRAIGPFDTSLPLMEDTFLAERIRNQGGWLLLPARIKTSPRRFLAEGLRSRQTLNAILMDLAALGRLDVIAALKECYRAQHDTQQLRLYPFLEVLREWIAAMPRGERKRLWRETGAFVRSNAWQIPFFIDVVRGKAQDGKGGELLALHDRLFGRLVENAAGDWLAALLVRLWFRLALALSR